MAVNEVIYDGNTLISLTSDTVTEDDLPEGVTAHDASGNQIIGTKKYVRSVNNITPDDEGNVTLEKVDGKSAYEIWLEQGNEGTEDDFLESLKGKDGAPGISGVYVGSGDMPEGYNVQIDPDGDVEVDLLAKIDEALVEAKTYTDEELAPVETLLGNVRNKVMLNSSSIGEMRIQIADLQSADDAVLRNAKTYTDEEIAKFDFIKVVDSLPDVGLPNKVYFVPKTDTQTQDLFDEFVWINKGTDEAPDWDWEWITTKQLEVDLTNYATTTAVNNAIIARSELEHPVGSIYLSTSGTDPKSFFGFGTWSLIAQDRMLIGAGNTYTAGKTGGSETHTHDVAFRFASYYNEVVLEKHEATGIMSYAEDGTKTATGNERVAYTSADSENNYYNAGTEGNRTSSGQIGVYESEGNTSYESSLPPYLAVFMWQRIA